MCIDDVLVIGKGGFYQHIDQIRVIFSSLCATGMKFNAPKCILGLKYIPYLGYVITQELIKPDMNKVQDIMDLEQHTIKTEAQALIGMVQYYGKIWLRRSHVLAPLSYASIKPKGRSILWNDNLEVSLKDIK